jgi:hypothetical protein
MPLSSPLGGLLSVVPPQRALCDCENSNLPSASQTERSRGLRRSRVDRSHLCGKKMWVFRVSLYMGAESSGRSGLKRHKKPSAQRDLRATKYKRLVTAAGVSVLDYVLLRERLRFSWCRCTRPKLPRYGSALLTRKHVC